MAPEAVAKVMEKILEGVGEAGWEALPAEAVAGSIGRISPDGPCAEADCLAEVAKDAGADEALLISIVDEDRTSYDLKVALANREGVEVQKTAGFFVVLEWLRGTVALILQKPAREPEEVEGAAPVAAGEIAGEGEAEIAAKDGGGEEDGPGENGPANQATPKDGKKLGPVPFYVSAAATGALLISWGVTDAVVHSRYEELRDDDMEREDWLEKRDSARSLQTADRVLLGIAAAGVLATGVLFFLTDFDREVEEENPGVRAVGPTAFEGGGGLSIAGEF